MGELPKYYEQELEFCRNLEPDIVEPEILDNQLLESKAHEKALLVELADKKVELCNALVECIEMRFGSDQQHDMELKKGKFQVEQVKAE